MSTADDIAKADPEFTEEAWVDVLKSVDQTYKELVEHQVALEERNAELESMRGFLTSVLSAMSEVLFVTGIEGQILEVNQEFLDLTGKTKEAVLGTPVISLFHVSDREHLKRDLDQLRQLQAIRNAERQLLTEDGSTPLELNARARLDPRGRYAGSVIIGRPIGELRRAYQDLELSHEALKEAQSQLVHSEKLASLGRLLAGVAHELNNPISFVYGNAHALDRYTQKFERYFERVEAGADRGELVALREELKLDRAVRNMRHAVAGALEGSERVRDIVESLRRLSAEGTGEAEPFDLVATAENAARWVIKGRASSIPIGMNSKGPVMAFGRPGHIQQIVMNLVQNAMDAMEDVEAPQIRLTVRKRGTRAVLEVADCGPGIPDDIALRVFDPFFTTKPVGRGTGLGLSISYKIAAENGGSLSLANARDGGAVFTLALPAT